MIFKDKISLGANKTLISVRDGYQEYYGYELGLSPHSKIFKVYRSPETLKEMIDSLDGIPVTNEHIDIVDVIPDNLIEGKILKSEFCDVDGKYDSTIGIKNEISISDNLLQLSSSGKSELSLGYTARVIDCNDNLYDFEQVEVRPHHLALVDAGRCGSVCRILDKKGNNIMLINEDGTLNIEALETLLTELPNILPLLSDEQKATFMSAIGVSDEDKEDMKDEDKEDMKDEDKEDETTISDKAINTFKDSQEFRKIMDGYSDMKVEATLKAKNWIDGYDSNGKCLTQIMKDTLSVAKVGAKFEDNEVAVAFKMLDNKPLEVVKEMEDSSDKWAKFRN